MALSLADCQKAPESCTPWTFATKDLCKYYKSILGTDKILNNISTNNGLEKGDIDNLQTKNLIRVLFVVICFVSLFTLTVVIMAIRYNKKM